MNTYSPPLVWRFLIAATALFFTLDLLTELTLPYQATGGMLTFQLALWALFVADLVLNLRLLINGTKAWDSRALLLLVSDVVSIIPLFFVFQEPVWLVFQAAKFFRIIEYMSNVARHQLHRMARVRFLFFSYWLIILIHAISCGWIVVGGQKLLENNYDTYIYSLYWTVTTIATVGYGDITPSTPAQMLFAISTMIIGVGTYGFVIGNIASMFGRMDPARTQYLTNMEHISGFMDQRGFPNGLKSRILRFYEYIWQKRLIYNEDDLLRELPPSLQAEVALFLVRDLLEHVPLFKDAGENFIRDIAKQLKPLVLTPGEFLFQEGDYGTHMYFISNGELAVIGKEGNSINTLSKGMFFGEMALYSKKPRNAGIKALTYCDLYALDKPSFEIIVERYPLVKEKIGEVIRKREMQTEL